MTQIQHVRLWIPMVVGGCATALTIFIHALAVIVTVNFVRHERDRGRLGRTHLANLGIISLVAGFLFVAHLLEIAMWAALFMMCGEFQDFGIAFYHSAVNYTTLGYGDIIMSPPWKLLGPLEAADGWLMFGISTAILFTVVHRLLLAKFVDLRE